MPNTINPALVTTTLVSSAIATAELVLAPLPRFARIVESDPKKPRCPGVVPQVTAASQTLRNPTNYESGDGVIEDVPFTPAELSQPFHVAADDTRSGLTLKHLARSNAQVFSKAILDEVLAIFTEANYGLFATVAAPAFGQQEIDAAIDSVRSPQRALLLETRYYAKVAPSLRWNGREWTMPGFTGVFEVADFSAAGPGIVGAVCDPDSVIVPWATPVTIPRAQIQVSRFELPQVGLSCNLSVWGVPGTKSAWASYDAVVAAAVGNADSCKLIKSA
jgi:hypothetical protein